MLEQLRVRSGGAHTSAEFNDFDNFEPEERGNKHFNHAANNYAWHIITREASNVVQKTFTPNVLISGDSTAILHGGRRPKSVIPQMQSQEVWWNINNCMEAGLTPRDVHKSVSRTVATLTFVIDMHMCIMSFNGSADDRTGAFTGEGDSLPADMTQLVEQMRQAKRSVLVVVPKRVSRLNADGAPWLEKYVWCGNDVQCPTLSGAGFMQGLTHPTDDTWHSEAHDKHREAFKQYFKDVYKASLVASPSRRGMKAVQWLHESFLDGLAAGRDEAVRNGAAFEAPWNTLPEVGTFLPTIVQWVDLPDIPAGPCTYSGESSTEAGVIFLKFSTAPGHS